MIGPAAPIASHHEAARSPSSSARSAARSRRSGWDAAPTAAPGTRSSRSARPRRRRRRRAATRYAWPAATGAQLYADIDVVGRRPALDRHRRVRSRARRRHRARLARAARRRARHRQVDAAAAGGGAHRARRSGPVLYSSGEESEHQIKSRGERLGVGDAPLYLLAETCLERILEEIARLKPALRHRRFDPDGVLAEVPVGARAASARCARRRRSCCSPRRGRTCRRSSSATSRRTGSLAGPKALEHIVDTVLYFEGETPPLAPRRARGEEPLRRRQRAGRVRDDRRPACKPVPNPSQLFLAERPAERARLGRAVLHRGLAADARRGAGARQHQHLRQRAAHGERHRPEPAVAAAGGAREAGRPEPGRRRRVREHRRRHEPSTSRRRTWRSWRPSRRACGTGRSPQATAVFGEVGLAGEVRGTAQAAAARPRGRADGLHALHHARGEHRPDGPGARRHRPASWSGSRTRPGGARASSCLIRGPDAVYRAASYTECPMAWFMLARLLFFVGGHVHGDGWFSPFRAGLAGERGLRRRAGGASSSSSRRGCADVSVPRILGALLGGALGLLLARADRPRPVLGRRGDSRVDRSSTASSILLFSVPGLRHRRPPRRVARAVAAGDAVPRGRPAAALQDPRHERHHRRPHRRHLRDRLPRRHAGRSRSSC